MADYEFKDKVRLLVNTAEPLNYLDATRAFITTAITGWSTNNSTLAAVSAPANGSEYSTGLRVTRANTAAESWARSDNLVVDPDHCVSLAASFTNDPATPNAVHSFKVGVRWFDSGNATLRTDYSPAVDRVASAWVGRN